MEEVAKAVAVSVMFMSMAAIFVLRGPVGRALAERLSGRRSADEGAAQLQAEVEAMRRRLAEAEERLDFAERLLARSNQADRVSPPR